MARVKKIFFVSGTYPFHSGIYPGVGPEFGRAYGWEVRPLEALATAACDVGIVENRLLDPDVEHLERFLTARAAPRFPLLFKISDPDMPRSPRPGVRYLIGKGDAPGVHYLSVYEPAGPVAEFFASLRTSRFVHAPYPYDVRREIEAPLDGRTRRVFLSGARSRRLYPLRESMFRHHAFNPVARRVIARLPHPGYPPGGRLTHDVVGARFVPYAARYTHFFLDPSRYGVELMKYTECAYAGSVPIGTLPASLGPTVARCFLQSECRTRDLLAAVRAALPTMAALATAYRAAIRVARDPVRLNAAVDAQIERLLFAG